MYLVQILLPLYDNHGKAQPNLLFQEVREELTRQFSGLTVYSRAPAEGLWEKASKETVRDDVVLFEVMVESIDRSWWERYRKTLETRFRQNNVIARAQEIVVL